MNIIDALIGEHGTIDALCDYLEDELPRATTRPFLMAAGRVFAAALQSHLALEDELVCASVEHVRQRLAVGCEMAHEEIDRALAQLDRARTGEEAKSVLLGVIGFARRHSAGQEQWLFPEARRELSDYTLERQGARWAARRGVHIPCGGTCVVAGTQAAALVHTPGLVPDVPSLA
jgi:hypothetical protein